MKKILSVLLSVTMLLSLTTALAVPASVSAASKTGKKYVTYKTYNKTIKKSGTVILKGTAKYPQLKSKSASAKKINKYIKKNVKNFADNIISMAKNDYSKNGLKYFNLMGGSYVYTIKSKLTYNQKGKYSFRMSQYSYSLGAHGYEAVTGLNFSKKTGKTLSNSKLTKYSDNSIKKKIVAKLKKKIEKEPNKYYTNTLDTVQNMKFKNFIMWLKDKYLYVHFNAYDIASYAAGPTTLKIKL